MAETYEKGGVNTRPFLLAIYIIVFYNVVTNSSEDSYNHMR